jgi:hypothetical protein
MKKIGIITFHRSHNCGSILQSYAMQETLKKYGNQPEFIDFATKGQKELYSVFRPFKYNTPRNFIKSIYKNGLSVVLYRRAKQNWTSYDNYINNHLNVSKKSYNNNYELIEADMDYDKYLTGSDQVWNIVIDDYDDAYFLNFVHDHPKIAYAVSQGAKDIIKYTNNPSMYKDLISDFNYLSVREPNGQKWIKNSFNINSEVVLDPTLLLDKEDYINIEEPVDENLEKNSYIFVYATKMTKDFENIIKKTAKKEGLKIVVWQPDTWVKMLGWSKGYILPKKQNPGKYLTLMKNAKYVFTASFHGVIFAAQYRKNFWVLQNSGMDINKDDRILSLLNNFKLAKRLLQSNEQDKNISDVVDYEYFKSKILVDRKKSFNFLDRAVK